MKSNVFLSAPAFAAALALGLAACTPSADGPDAQAKGEVNKLETAEIAADVASAMDMSADPCQDFYRYACGGWLDSTELPGDEARWVRSFSVIDERNRQVLGEILDDQHLVDSYPKLANYYGSCLDETAVEELGTAPIQPWLDRIAAAGSQAALMRVVGDLHNVAVFPMFGMAVFADLEEGGVNMLHTYQGGLGLPDRDYYLLDDDKAKENRQKYEEHVQRMFQIMGRDAAGAKSAYDNIMSIEMELAKIARPRARMRQIQELTNKMSLADFKAASSNVDWNTYFSTVGLADLPEINVMTPEFFERLSALMSEIPLESWKDYIAWNVINATAPHLNKELVDADFDFYSRTLRGQQEQRTRRRLCISRTNGALGEMLGQAFVDRKFAGNSKEISLSMIGNIQDAFAAALPELAWMDDETRTAAIEKKDVLLEKIGYPDEWRDYSSMTIELGNYFGNVLAANRFEADRQRKKIGQPIDKKEWAMSPPTVNAYYNPTVNEIVFPAGILQPPFFHKDFPAAMNFGGIGMVMGHELSHGFDDSGRKFDPSGKLADWWTPESVKGFEKRVSCVEEQYSSYEVQPDLFINAKLTMGENIADMGGLKQAYDAYRMNVSDGSAPSIVEGLTEDQLFFVSFGQVWCSKQSDEAERQLVLTDSHSPARFRVIGPIANHKPFAEAFQCTEGAPMNPVNKCEVW